MEDNVHESFRKMALSLPGMIESITYGTPSFKLKDKLLARFHEDGESLVLKMDFETRDFHMQINPDSYYITDHYIKYPFVLVKLYNIDFEELKGHLHRIWRLSASKRLLKAYENTL